MRSIYRQIYHVARRQLFARVPKAHEAPFREHLFFNNVSRFSIQSTVLVLMDAGLLVSYLLSRGGQDVSRAYIAVLAVKVALVALCSFLFARMYSRPYKADCFIHQHTDVFYPVLHAIAEVVLFLTGPQDLGACIRLFAVPFIVGGIPIISQLKSVVILTGLYLSIFFILPRTDYAQFIQPHVSVFNFWAVAFTCSLFISFTVYSWFVNNFTATFDSEKANAGLIEANERLDVEVRQRTRLLEAVNAVSTDLLRSSTDNFDRVLFHSMKKIGKAVDVDRVYMWRNHMENGELYCTQTHEWSGGAEPQQGNELTVSVPFPGNWYPKLSANLCINNMVREFGGYEREHLEAQDIVSILVVPVFIDDEFWGFVGFDDCERERVFSDIEEAILRTISLLFSTSFTRNELTLRLIQATNEAVASSKAKSDFLANMSHEIRTPINAITGMSSIARMASDEAELHRCLDRIEAASRQLLSIINDVLDMSKIEAGKIELSEMPFRLREMLHNIQSIIGVQAGDKGLQLVAELADDLPDVVIGDDMRLSQILLNLLSNAVKFTPRGGRIVFRVQRVQQHPDGRDELAFSVRDTGIGITPEQLSSLFDKFNQADGGISRQYGGTGLGLAISKSLAAIMNGTIDVESVPGEGSCFTARVRLRAGTSDMLPTAQEQSSLQTLDFSGRRALLVEDIDLNREIVVAMLADTGLAIDEAADGQEALDRVAEAGTPYDVIFMDLHMPVMDGYTATRELRQLGHKMPIIAMTANAFAEDIARCLEAGMDDHVAKPIDFDELVNKLNHHLRTE